jgi:LuxR family maltose regulon positive regulatory protein
LQLAALSLQGQADIAAFVRNFTGSHRYIMDYLLEEALQRQSPEVQDFLLRTSILERFCASLCDALFDDGTSAGQEILEYLEAVNLFIVPLDDARHWYRYHTLFAELLSERLLQRMPLAERSALHVRAAAWYAANGWIAEAIAHALAGEDYAAATALIEQYAADFLWQQGRFRLVRQWAAGFPDAWVAQHPALRVIKAVSLSAGGEMDVAEDHLRAIEDDVHQILVSTTGRDDILGQVALTRAHLAAARHEISETIEWCHQALARIRPTDIASRGLIFMLLGGSYYARGELNAAEQSLQESLRLMLSTDQHVAVLFSLGLLSQVDLKRGALRRAAARRDQAVALVPQAESIPAMGVTYLALGEVLRQWNDLDGAYRCLTHGLELYRAPEEVISQRHTLGGYLSLAKIYHARGDLAGAAAVLDDADRFFSLTPVEPDNGESLTVAHVWLQLVQGDLESAGRWAQAYVADSPSPMQRGHLLALYIAGDLLVARIYLACRQWEAALSWLADLQDHPDLQQCGETLIEIHLLTALAEQGRGQLTAATAALERALTLAREENYFRIFLEAGLPMLNLFRAGLKYHIDDPYFQRILAALEAEIEVSVMGVDKPVEKGGVIHTSRDVDALSERELEVLRLMAAGFSNPEIARKLIVTEGTIKTHTHHIYAKLSVRNRTEALNRARELNLL